MFIAPHRLPNPSGYMVKVPWGLQPFLEGQLLHPGKFKNLSLLFGAGPQSTNNVVVPGIHDSEILWWFGYPKISGNTVAHRNPTRLGGRQEGFVVYRDGVTFTKIDKPLQDSWNAAEVLKSAGSKFVASVLENGTFRAQPPATQWRAEQLGNSTDTRPSVCV